MSSSSLSSEGLAIASYEMFSEGKFSSDRAVPHRANSLGLIELTVDDFRKGYQVTADNPMIGVEGRVGKLRALGESMDKNPQFFGAECPRPGRRLESAPG